MISFPRYFLGTIVFPRKAFRRLVGDPRGLRQGFFAVLAAGLGLAALSFLRGVLGGVPLAPVFFGLPPYNYFALQTLFALPLLVAAWMLSSAVLRLLTGGRAGEGGMPAAAGFALALPVLLAEMPYGALSILMLLGMPQAEGAACLSSPGPWQTAFLTVHALAALWAWFLAARAAGAARKASRGRAVIAGLAAAGLEVAILIVFAR